MPRLIKMGSLNGLALLIVGHPKYADSHNIVRSIFIYRIEHRLPDGATNLYLTHTLILAAGLDGIESQTGRLLESF